MQHYVLGFMFNLCMNKVLLMEKKKPDGQAGLLNGLGGKVEECETPLGAMVRKFKEESDLTHAQWQRYATMEGEVKVHCYCARSDEMYYAKAMSDEPVIVVDVDHSHLKHVVAHNVNWLLPLALDYLDTDSHIEQATITYAS